MYPIVLAHGLFGFDRFFLWKMFEGIKELYQSYGLEVLQPLVHPVSSISYRSEQLNKQIIATYGIEQKIHIIAHSMGGLDSRFLISPNGLNQGHRVCTLTTLSTPHYGSELAENIPNWLKKVVITTAKIISLFPLPHQEANYLKLFSKDSWEALMELSPQYVINNFNPLITDHPATNYLSYAGDINLMSPTMILKVRKYLGSLLEENNDGMVGVSSAKWGNFQGTIPTDHGSFTGLRVIPWSDNGFNHKDFFLKILDKIKSFE
jgi:triacylglycerol lipase